MSAYSSSSPFYQQVSSIQHFLPHINGLYVSDSSLGLYPPAGRQVFTEDLKWQPIPVHTVPLTEERVRSVNDGVVLLVIQRLNWTLCLLLQLLSFPLYDCPRYTQLQNETEHTEEFLNATVKYKVHSASVFLHLWDLCIIKDG